MTTTIPPKLLEVREAWNAGARTVTQLAAALGLSRSGTHARLIRARRAGLIPDRPIPHMDLPPWIASITPTGYVGAVRHARVRAYQLHEDLSVDVLQALADAAAALTEIDELRAALRGVHPSRDRLPAYHRRRRALLAVTRGPMPGTAQGRTER